MKLHLQFGRLRLAPRLGATHVPTFLAQTMEEVRTFNIPDSSATYYVVDSGIRVVDDSEVYLIKIGAAAGQEYTGLDESTGQEQKIGLQKRKVVGHASALIDEDGSVVHESRSTYLTGPKVLAALDKFLRLALGPENAFSIDAQSLDGSSTVMRHWLSDLETVRYVRFTKLRHSNPHPPVRYLDELTDALVDEITQRSSGPPGITKDHPAFQATLDHVERYGQISTVSGSRAGWDETLEESDGEMQLTVAGPKADRDSIMLRVLRRVRRRPIRPQGSPGDA